MTMATVAAAIEDMNSTDLQLKRSRRTRRKSGPTKEPSAGGLFPVEKIIAERLVNGKVQFKVKWKGYSQAEDSWEPEENLSNVSDLIIQFRRYNAITVRPCSQFRKKQRQSARAKTRGRYEYVAHGDLIAPKSKYFDDIRDGKIDLTKNDLYSRVKTRKRLECLEMEAAEELTDDLCPKSPDDDNGNGLTNRRRLSSTNSDVVYGTTNVEATKVVGVVSGCSTLSLSCPPSSREISISEDSPTSPVSAPCLSSILDPSGAPLSSPITNCALSEIFENDDGNSINDNNNKQVKNEESASQFEKSDPDTPLMCDFKQAEAMTLRRKFSRVSPINALLARSLPPSQPVKIEDEKQNSTPVVVPSVTPRELVPELPYRPHVSSEKELIRIYTKQTRCSTSTNPSWTPSCLPQVQLESNYVHLKSAEDLSNAIVFNRWNLLYKVLSTGQPFNLDATDSRGFPLLMQAIQRDRLSIVRLLLRHGASPNVSEVSTGKTALMLAAELGHVHSAKTLLEFGALTDKRNSLRHTALHVAISCGRLPIVDLLLRQGTNFYAVDPTHTAINLVSRLKTTSSASTSQCYVDAMTLTRIHDLIYEYHNRLSSAVQATVSQYLTKLNLRHEVLLLPCQWVSVMEGRYEIELRLTSSVELHTPLLLLVHGIQCGSSYHFWLEDGPCLVRSVVLNGVTQAALRQNSFVTTLYPLMCPREQTCSNRLIIDFHSPESPHDHDRLLRVAILAIDVVSLD